MRFFFLLLFVIGSLAPQRGSADPVSDNPVSSNPVSSNSGSSNPGSLDPEEGRYFVASVAFDLRALPRPQDRISIFSKLSNFGRSPVGYGVSLRGFKTSVRPQVYWSAADGDGGFFTFGDYPFKPRRRYTLTLVVRPGEFASLYVQERDRSPSKSEPLGKKLSTVSFLGGHELRGVSTPHNNSALNYRTAEDGTGANQVSVLAVFVAITDKLKDSTDKLVQSLSGAPERLAEDFKPADVRLWEYSSVPNELQ